MTIERSGLTPGGPPTRTGIRRVPGRGGRARPRTRGRRARRAPSRGVAGPAHGHGRGGFGRDREAVCEEELPAGLPRVETEVRGVEDAARRVLEPSREEREADGDVGHVRERHEEPAVRPHETTKEIEHGAGIGEVLEDVPGDDDVKGGLVERPQGLDEITGHAAVEEVRRGARRLGGRARCRRDTRTGRARGGPALPRRTDVEKPQPRAARLDLRKEDLVRGAGDRLPRVARAGAPALSRETSVRSGCGGRCRTPSSRP